jgi:glycogen phosphorylase
MVIPHETTGRPGAAGERAVAYFSMEIALDAAIPTYAGGLGVLAGDALRAAADLDLPMVGVSLVHRKGYFRQHLDAGGVQTESPDPWSPEQCLHRLHERAEVRIEGRRVAVAAWRYTVRGASTRAVPVYLLDTDLPENDPRDRRLTDHLYGGDESYRLAQEAVLGEGGVRLLAALGYDVSAYHMNEGHSSLLALALLQEQLQGRGLSTASAEDLAAVRARCVFTTHTPVPAGHDRFPVTLVSRLLGEEVGKLLERTGCCPDGLLNMTYLALFFSRFINGVALRHGEISRGMFPGYPIGSITNGVHASTWVSAPFRALYDRHIPQWRRQNLNLRYAVNIPLEEVRAAHAEAKRALFREVEGRAGVRLDPDALTVGFARRAALYKRPGLVFQDVERLRRIAREVGPLQFVFAGKAHPRDGDGRAEIQAVFQGAAALAPDVPVVYLANYDIALARVLSAGVDLWLNTPQPPWEASGTSGMKAALNGVPSLSALDGWWVEGYVEGVTGWAIGETGASGMPGEGDGASLYRQLEETIGPMYYRAPFAYAEVMRSAIALNGSFFNAERMMFQYAENAYEL